MRPVGAISKLCTLANRPKASFARKAEETALKNVNTEIRVSPADTH